MLLATTDGRQFLRANKAICKMLGYERDELLKLGVHDIHPPESLARVRKLFDALVQRRVQFGRNVPFLRKDKRLVWADVTALAVKHQGKPRMLGFFQEAAWQPLFGETLNASVGTLRSLLDNLPDVLLILDEKVRIQFANRSGEKLEREALLGRNARELLAPEYREVCWQALQDALADGKLRTVEALDIFGRWWLGRLVPLTNDKGQQRLLVIATDVTRLRASLETIKKERRLLRQILDLHERERRLIAYEIHDGLAQQLAGAIYRLQAFPKTLEHNSPNAWKSFTEAAHLVAQAFEESRRLISGLRPPVLDELGVIAAIEYLLYELEKEFAVKIEFEHDGSCLRLPSLLENAVFRIVQEALRNACCHSRSERISVRLVRNEERVQIDVRDWGLGFDVAATPRPKSFGLRGIRERTRLLGGSVIIDSAAGQGTHISVSLPLPKSDRHTEE